MPSVGNRCRTPTNRRLGFSAHLGHDFHAVLSRITAAEKCRPLQTAWQIQESASCRTLVHPSFPVCSGTSAPPSGLSNSLFANVSIGVRDDITITLSMNDLVNPQTAPTEKSSPGTPSIEEVETSSNEDAFILAEGYLPPSTRPFRLPSLLALGFSTSNTWLAVTGALVTGIANGGPVIYIYGSIFMFLIHLCVSASLGELASAYPNSGGQYYWVLKLWEGRGGAAWWGYVTGFTAWAGAVVTGASCALLVAQGSMGCAILTHEEVVYERWMGFMVYQVCCDTRRVRWWLILVIGRERTNRHLKLLGASPSSLLQSISLHLPLLYDNHHHLCSRRLLYQTTR